jgi:mRNA interferase HigB
VVRVRVIKKKVIEDFANMNPESRPSFKHWLRALKGIDWIGPADITGTFGSADLLGNGSDRVVFNMAGNRYRMIGKYRFGRKRVRLYVKWIGTHAEYSKLCAANKQFIVNNY